MNETDLQHTAERLAAAVEALDQALARTLDRLDAGHAALHAAVERIVATLDQSEAEREASVRQELEARVAELERQNAELQARVAQPPLAVQSEQRKTLPPLVTGLLSKFGLESETHIDPAVLDKTLAALSVEQRIAVKAQMARAGLID